MWDCYGLEGLVNVTVNQQQNLISILKEEPVKHSNPLQYMLLRARFNVQREYEIYVFESEFTDDELVEMFTDSPQVIVDAIRNVGKVLFDGRLKNRSRVIV